MIIPFPRKSSPEYNSKLHTIAKTRHMFNRGIAVVLVILCSTSVSYYETNAESTQIPNQKNPEEPVPKRFPDGETGTPSIVQLLAHRDRYHGEKVTIKGYLHVRFEGTAIYLTKDCAEFGIANNGFWVEFDKRAVPYEGAVGPKQFDKKYVLLEGTFDKDSLGHKSMWKGTIKNVTRVSELTRSP